MPDVLVAVLADLGREVLFPSREPQIYPVLAGPGTLYPAPPPVEGPCCAGCGYLRGHHEGEQRQCPGLKTKTFQVPGPIDTADWREIMRRDMAARERALHPEPYVSPVVPPPRVPARPPLNRGEFATRAIRLGSVAMVKGWDLAPWYWTAHDGAEGCAVTFAKGMLRAVATWKRAPDLAGKLTGWTADVAYAWRQDVARVPMKVTHTTLEGLIA